MNYKKLSKKLKNAIVLVDGGAGFIGSSMCRKLISLGSFVICFDNLSTGSFKNIEDLKENKNFVFIKGDVNKLFEINQVFEKFKIDYVFHYAAIVGVKRTLAEPLKVLGDLEGIKNILHLSRIYKIKKVIYSSSSEVYGDPVEFPQKEDSTPLNTRLPYALIKGIGESYFENFYKKYRLPTTNLRFFNVYGPSQNYTPYGFVTAIFIKQALNNEELSVFGDGSQTRDFVFIEDNINPTLSALISSESNGQSINIGTGKEVSILELAKKIINISKKNLKIKFCPSRKIGDMKGRRPDITKMVNILKYKPEYEIEMGLKSTYNWYKNNEKTWKK
jgi:UDP-glucose 4-epimerase